MRISGDLVWLTRKAKNSVLQDMGVVRQSQGAIDILLDSNECHTRLLQDYKGLVKPVHHDWRETKADLVENDEAGARHQRATDCEHLPLPARHRSAAVVPAFGENREQIVALEKVHQRGLVHKDIKPMVASVFNPCDRNGDRSGAWLADSPRTPA